MSWDVILLSISPDVQSMDDIDDDSFAPLGTTDDVRKVLIEAVPNLDLSDPTWGILEAPEYSIEFSIGKEEPCDSVMLHVRGEDGAIAPIQAVCEASGWKALDCSDGEIIEFDSNPAQGLRSWREYRDRVAPGSPTKGVSLAGPDGNRVFFDALPQSIPQDPDQKRPWWQFWKRNG